jgi:hypothetical protein
MGVYEPRFAQIVAINYTDMRNIITYEGDVTVQHLRDPGELAMLREIAQAFRAKLQEKTLPPSKEEVIDVG